MGRHTKLLDQQPDQPGDLGPFAVPPPRAPVRERPRAHWLGRVPLLPVVAGVAAVGVVAAAFGTSEISLNFAGGSPAGAQATGPCDTGCADPGSAGDPQASPDPPRTGVTVAFTTTSRTAGGFRGTVTIVNSGPKAVNGWTLTFAIPNAKVLSASGAVLVRAGSVATVRTRMPLKAGGTVRVIFTARGTAGDPSSCSFNKAACVRGAPNT